MQENELYDPVHGGAPNTSFNLSAPGISVGNIKVQLGGRRRLTPIR